MNCQTLDTRAGFMSWADHCGQLTLEDVDCILHSHGFTVTDWLNDCDARGWHDRTRSAETLLTWLGY